MKEEDIIGLAHGLARVYYIYKEKKTLQNQEVWLTNLKAYSFAFKKACDDFYGDNKTPQDWLRYISKKQKSRGK